MPTTVATHPIPEVSKFAALIQKQAAYCWAKIPKPAPLEFEDLIAEGNLAYVQAAQSWGSTHPSRSKFITYFYPMLQHHFGRILNQIHQSPHCISGNQQNAAAKSDAVWDPEDPKAKSPADLAQFRMGERFLHRLSHQAWRAARLFLEGSAYFHAWEREQYKAHAHNPRSRLLRIFRYLNMPKQERAAIVKELQNAMKP